MKKLPLALLIIVIALAWFGYWPGVTGGLHYDDKPNLANLTSASTPLLQADFILNGRAGPTGRPFSLLTFILQREHWPNGLPVLLQTNIALHLLAGAAVFLLSWGIAQALTQNSARSSWTALATTALWLFSPFLASASLMLVQRMTILSGLFVFLGLAFYVWGRLLQSTHSYLALGLIWSALIPFTALATLSKENGALLLPLVLVIEHTILRRIPSLRPVNRLVHLFLLLTTLAVVSYLAAGIPLLMTQGWRDFTPWQRLISQPPILLDYIYNLLIPRTAASAPYTHWTFAIPSVFDLRFLASMVVLMIGVIFSWRNRKSIPVLWFATTFFLVGHIIESSVIYLELYFAHRNYVPAFALYFLICHATIQHLSKKPALAGLALSSYASAFFGILLLTTSLWGVPRLAAEMWVKYYPNSMRAQHALAQWYTAEGNYQAASQQLDDLEVRRNSPGLYRAQTLLLCIHHDDEVEQRIQSISASFQRGPPMRAVGETVETLARRALKGECPTLTQQRVGTLVDALLSSKIYTNDQYVRSKALMAKALLVGENNEFTLMLAYLDQAFITVRHLDVGLFRINVLLRLQHFDEASQYLEELERYAPAQPLKRLVWKKRIKEWHDLVLAERSLQYQKEGLNVH